MSNEEEVELMMTDDNKSPNSQNSNRRDPAPFQLNSSRRRQLLNPNSNMTKSFPEASSSRVNVVHNKLNSTEDRKNVTTKSNMDISLSSPEECTDNRTLNNQPLNKFKTYRKCNNVDDAMDTIDDDDDEDETKVMNKFEDSDDDNNVEVDDGMFRVAGFIDDKSEELEVDVNILRTICKNNRQKRPFVDLYTIPSQTHDTKDITMLLLESYNNWWRGYKAKNTFEPPQQQKPTVEPASASPKQTFANRMKGNNAVKSPQQNEIVQLIDVYSSSPLGENRGDGEEVLNNSTANIRSPVSEKEELFFNKAQDFPDLYSRTTAIAKELRSPTASSYNNRSRTNQTSAATSRSSNIELEIATDERWDPNSGSWTNTNRKGKQRQANNDLNKPNNDQSKADEKVQCPICQLSFSVNKVEDHAAQCFQFPMETRSNNQDTNKSLNISRDAPEQAALNNSVDLTESDDEEWEQVRTKANKRKGCSDEDDLNGTDNVKRACRKIQ